MGNYRHCMPVAQRSGGLRSGQPRRGYALHSFCAPASLRTAQSAPELHLSGMTPATPLRRRSTLFIILLLWAFSYASFTLFAPPQLAERWCVHYNTVRPHSSLGYRPPAPEAWAPSNTGYGEVESILRFRHPRRRLLDLKRSYTNTQSGSKHRARQ